MNFGNYAILGPVEHTFEKEPTWTWTIKPIDMGAELAMSQFMARDRFVVFPDGARALRQITTEEIAMREIALTFGGTTIPAVREAVDTEVKKQATRTSGALLLPEDATIAAVEGVLCSMPPAMVKEIWEAVGQACPPWGPQLPNQKDEGQAKKAPGKKS